MKKFIVLSALLWAACSHVTHAAITPDAFLAAEHGGTLTSTTISFTVGNDWNRGLYVFTRTNNVSVSSVKWNGTALSAVDGSLINDTMWGHRFQWFHLENPDSGTHNLEIALDSSGYLKFFIHSYSGVAQSGQPDAVATSVQTTSQTETYEASITTITDGSWVIGGTFTEYSDQTISLQNVTQRNESNYAYSWDTNSSVTAGNFTANFSTSPQRRWYVDMLALNPATGIIPDAFLAAEHGGTLTSTTVLFTVGSGSNRGLYVFTRTNNIAVSSVTWNGTAFTAVDDSLIDDTTWGHRFQWFHLENPDSGTHDLQITLNSSGYLKYFIHSYSGVAQSGQPDVVATSTQTSSQTYTYDANITTLTDGSWIIGGTFTEYSDQTLTLENVAQRNEANYSYSWDTNGPIGIGNFTGEFSTTPNQRRWYVDMLAIKPVGIAADAFDSVVPDTSTSSVMKAFTVGDGANLGLYVLVRTDAASVSSVRWNGTELIAIDESAINDTTNSVHMKWFGLEDPDSGTHDLVVDLTSDDDCAIFIHSYSGVAQSGQPDVAATSTQATDSTMFSPAITTVTDGSWVVAGVRANYEDPDGTGYEFTFDSAGPKDPAGQYTAQFATTFDLESGNMAVRNGSSFARKWYATMIALKPAI